jgi:hypothetical protein
MQGNYINDNVILKVSPFKKVWRAFSMQSVKVKISFFTLLVVLIALLLLAFYVTNTHNTKSMKGYAPTAAITQRSIMTKAEWQTAIKQVRMPSTGCYHASYPSLQWHAVKCVAPPKWPMPPAIP